MFWLASGNFQPHLGFLGRRKRATVAQRTDEEVDVKSRILVATVRVCLFAGLISFP
jgi:hypothetical protein